MTDSRRIEGIAAPLPMPNLDTDQIMPKQFLKGVDKSGLDEGVLYNLRFDSDGTLRPDFVLNRPEYRAARILVAGENFGCGSSREHAVWGLLQYGIAAVVAPSFGEIFYSNAMNNRLLLASFPEADVEQFLADASQPVTASMVIDVDHLTIRSASHSAAFELSPRHHKMFREGVDLLGTSLGYLPAIRSLANGRWTRQPWLQGIGGSAPRYSPTRARAGRAIPDDAFH